MTSRKNKVIGKEKRKGSRFEKQANKQKRSENKWMNREGDSRTGNRNKSKKRKKKRGQNREDKTKEKGTGRAEKDRLKTKRRKQITQNRCRCYQCSFIYKSVSQFFEISIFSQDIWGNVHYVPEISLIS